jgi:phosphoglycolate phosphatase-like HAD superfamily hydrolase
VTYRVVVFDFDGVIVESTDVKDAAYRELFSVHPERLDEIMRLHFDHVGLSRSEQFRMIYEEILGLPFDEAERDRLDRAFSSLVVDAVVACPFVPGTTELLERLHETHALFVASATPEEELREIVRLRGLAPYFRGVYGAPARKTDILQRVLEETGAARSELLFVGDAPSDFAAASEVGVPFAGRLHAGRPSPFPEDRPVVVIDDLHGLFRVLVTQPASTVDDA